MNKFGNKDLKHTLYCSFCGKSQHEVRKLIAGPTVYICNECVELCKDILYEESRSSLAKSRNWCRLRSINKLQAPQCPQGEQPDAPTSARDGFP